MWNFCACSPCSTISFEDLLAALGCFQSQLWPKRSPACAKRQPWQHLPMIRAPGARSDSNLGQVEVLPWTFEGNHDCYSKCSSCYSYKALDAPVMTYDYSVQWCPKSFWQTNLQKIASGPYFDYFDGEPAELLEGNQEVECSSTMGLGYCCGQLCLGGSLDACCHSICANQTGHAAISGYLSDRWLSAFKCHLFLTWSIFLPIICIIDLQLVQYSLSMCHLS